MDGRQALPSAVHTTTSGAQWWVLCFCAQWCGVCRGFQAVFEALEAQFPGLRTAWVDVEDDEAIVGDLDIETFPTILIAGAGQARFFGPVLPQAGVLVRLIDSLQSSPDATLSATPPGG